MVLGAVQVPPNGQPVVFLNDHPTTGGYPVIGVVARRRPAAVRAAAPGRRGHSSGGLNGVSAGSSTAKLSTVPGPVSAVSKRTVTTPRPEPHTQPRPWASCTTSMPGAQPRCREAAATAASVALVLSGRGRPRPPPRRRRGPPGSSRRARRPPRPRRRTPPEVSSSPSSVRATRAIWRGVVGGLGQGGRPAQRGEVVQPHLDRDRASGQPRLAQPLGDLGRLAVEQRDEQPRVDVVGVVGVLDADRLGLALGLDGAVVLGAGEGVEAGAVGPAEQPHQLVLGQPLELLDGVHADPSQPLGGGRADAGDDGDLHRAAAGPAPCPGATTTRPSGLSRSLAILAISLEEPMPTEPVSAAGDLVHPLLEVAGQGADRGDAAVGQVGGLEVDERLVEGQRLDQRADLAQQRHHRAAGVAVGVEPAGEEGGVRAAAPRLGGGHRRVHPEGAGLVGRGRDHAAAADAADDDRLAAQRGLVALLHGGEEGVEIHVQDRRLGAHAVIVPRRHRRVLPRPVSRFASTGRIRCGLSTGRPSAACRRRGRLRGWRHDLDQPPSRPVHASSPARRPTWSPSCRWCSASIPATRSCC